MRRPYLKGYGDRYVRIAAVLFVLALTLWTGWLVGVVTGRHEARMAQWQDCAAQQERSGYVQAVFAENPCEGR